jgi:hypothetical protein
MIAGNSTPNGTALHDRRLGLEQHTAARKNRVMQLLSPKRKSFNVETKRVKQQIFCTVQFFFDIGVIYTISPTGLRNIPSFSPNRIYYTKFPKHTVCVISILNISRPRSAVTSPTYLDADTTHTAHEHFLLTYISHK